MVSSGWVKSFSVSTLKATEQVCIDSSALINYEIDPHDLQRFDGKVLTQTVYRHKGLKRNALPPKQPPNTAETGHKSDEEVAECPNLTPTGVGRTFADKDCRYAASVCTNFFVHETG